MRCLGLSTEVWVGSDQSWTLISSLARLGVSGRMRVFVHLHFSLLMVRLVLQPPADSYSHYHLLVLFNQGIKSFQDSNYNDLLSAGSEARQHARHPLALCGTSSGIRSARRDGSDSAPTLTASTSHLHSWQAQPRANVHG